MSLCLILKSTWFFCVIFKTVIIAHDPNFSQFIWSRPKFNCVYSKGNEGYTNFVLKHHAQTILCTTRIANMQQSFTLTNIILIILL